MRVTTQGVKVSIMGREFTVACPDEEREALGRAATDLDHRMREIQKGGKAVSLERCAIIAALNVTHELLDARKSASQQEVLQARVKSLQDKIESVMQEQKQLTL